MIEDEKRKWVCTYAGVVSTRRATYQLLNGDEAINFKLFLENSLFLDNPY